jgi:hypothetical protein
LVDGKRKKGEVMGGSICVSNPEVARIVADNIVEFARTNPEVEIVDIWPNDTLDWCQCEACTAMEGPADYVRFPQVFCASQDSRTRAYLRFVNCVAELVAKKNPRIKLGPLAYARCNEPPPDVEVAANVLVGFAAILHDWKRPINDASVPRNVACDEVTKAWRKKTPNFYVYEYYSFLGCNPLSSIAISVTDLAADLRHYRDIGMDNICTEDIGWRQMAMYAFGRLAWNLSLTPEEVIGDFCARYYGQAAQVMKEFWLAQEKRDEWEPRKKAGLAILARAKMDAENEKILGRIAALEKMFNLPNGERDSSWSAWGSETRF